MSNISAWSSTAADNNSAAPNGFPEGMAPSGVNDAAREVMAAIRTWYEDAQWINLGYTHTYASATSFTIASADYTSTYHVGRRIRAVGSSTGTIYGTITASSYSSSTTVTISWDSGSLQNESLTVSLAALTKTNDGIPYLYKNADDVTAASSIDLDAIRGDQCSISGTTSISTITLSEGQRRVVRFSDTLTLNHSTSLYIPGETSMSVYPGDVAMFAGYASAVVRCINFMKIDGTPIASPTTGTDLTLSGKLSTTDAGELTIASGAVTVTGSYHTLDTEGDASSDDLTTISGGSDGMRVVVNIEADARNVVIKHNSGNIFNPYQVDITLDVTTDSVELLYSDALSKWIVIKQQTRYDFLASKADPGYTYLPNGLIFQWGTESVANDTTDTVTLPVTYPNAHLQCQASYDSTNINIGDECPVNNFSTSQIKVTNGHSSTLSVFWFSIGY